MQLRDNTFRRHKASAINYNYLELCMMLNYSLDCKLHAHKLTTQIIVQLHIICLMYNHIEHGIGNNVCSLALGDAYPLQ